MEKSLRRLFPNQTEHDPSDLATGWKLAADQQRLPVGLLYHNPHAPCYEDLSSQGVDMTPEEKLAGINAALDRFAV